MPSKYDSYRQAGVRNQLTPAGIAIGVVGCVAITASSVYTALKMGALPWPSVFTSIVALVALRALGHRDLNEANVTQIIMSAGSMVAGGLAFTIPGIWMMGLADGTGWLQMLLVALAGTLLGLVCTALIRKRFVEESDLEYPIGIASAETLRASNAGGGVGVRLFGSMAFAGVWAVARDVLGWIPQLVLTLPIPGVSFGLYASPMSLSIGFLVGGAAVAFWFAGAVFANFGIIVGGNAAGLWDIGTAQGIVSSLGMGLMMGSGLGVVLKDVAPKVLGYVRSSGQGASFSDVRRSEGGLLALLVAAAALLVCFGLGLGPIVSAVVVALSFVTTVMSAQSVGQTGIDPMEIFGLIVLLAVAALGESDQVKLFYVAGIIAVACGLGGDVMSDFKAGKVLGSSPRAMWVGQAIGALLGALVSVAVLMALYGAYGPEAFGPGKAFVSAQASVVATMVSGIPSVPAFVLGLVAGGVLYCAGIPSMMLGLGVYLPFYMSLAAPLGALVKLAYDRAQGAGKGGAAVSGEDVAVAGPSGEARADEVAPSPSDPAPKGEDAGDEVGIVVASGLMGGESIVGVVIALATAVSGMMG